MREYRGAWELSSVKTRHIHTGSGLLVNVVKCHLGLPRAGVGVLITPTLQLLIKSPMCSCYFRLIFFRGLMAISMHRLPRGSVGFVL